MLRFGILGEHLPGTLAEYVVVPAAQRARDSADMPVETGGGVHPRDADGVADGRARAHVKQGDDVLIWGIGGGVALAALQI